MKWAQCFLNLVASLLIAGGNGQIVVFGGAVGSLPGAVPNVVRKRSSNMRELGCFIQSVFGEMLEKGN